MLKQQFSQKMLQKLSPQQIQLMKLLQLPTIVLDQRIKEEMETNPALEEGGDVQEQTDEQEDYPEHEGGEESSDPFEEDYFAEYTEDDPNYKTRGDSGTGDDTDRAIPIPLESSFHEYLESQLGLLQLDRPDQLTVAKQIVGSIDDDGYLRRDPASILDDLLFSQGIVTSEEEIGIILRKIQKFDPPGVGARDLQECLILQITARIAQEYKAPKELKEILHLAEAILKDHFDAFAKKHFDKLMRQLNICEDDLRSVMEEILKLNPKPANNFVDNSARISQYIVPDFIVENVEGKLELSLNSRNAPDLRISDQYKDMIRNYKRNREAGRVTRHDRDTILFIKQKIISAKWFIDAIKKRQETMYKTMFAIMQFQSEFFLTGDSSRIKPMILKDVAEVTLLDISTVSRVANSKFVQTEFGTKRLKDFFSESMQTQTGEEVSTLEVKKILEDKIKEEDKRKPHSDERLMELLLENNYNIARRTVAKYREQLGIPVARLRREL
ncbi:MAG: RNA polymerase factor sigma-54 [Saprospiraceae bacterium]